MTDDKSIRESEFDRFAEQYSAQHAANIAVSGESPDFFAEYKVVDIAGIAAEQGLLKGGLRVLDFGAGIGNSVPFFHKHLPDAKITCLDISHKSLELGKKRFGELAQFIHFDGGDLPFPDGSFDIVLCACVFHHIDHFEHEVVLERIRRLLCARGLLFVFEHNPLNPLTVRAVNTCPFDENATLISASSLALTLAKVGFLSIETRFRIFFPGPLRKLRPLEKFLYWCPVGAQYLLIAKQ